MGEKNKEKHSYSFGRYLKSCVKRDYGTEKTDEIAKELLKNFEGEGLEWGRIMSEVKRCQKCGGEMVEAETLIPKVTLFPEKGVCSVIGSFPFTAKTVGSLNSTEKKKRLKLNLFSPAHHLDATNSWPHLRIFLTSTVPVPSFLQLDNAYISRYSSSICEAMWNRESS